jgi:transcriptional regulator with XRE-family HTH domain
MDTPEEFIPLRDDISNRFLTWRTELRLSRRNVATYTGVSEKVIYNLERGKTFPGLETIYRVKRAFPDLNLNWLLTGEGEMRLGRGKESTAALAAEESVAERYQSHRDELIQSMKQHLKALQEENQRLKNELLEKYRELHALQSRRQEGDEDT